MNVIPCCPATIEKTGQKKTAALNDRMRRSQTSKLSFFQEVKRIWVIVKNRIGQLNGPKHDFVMLKRLRLGKKLPE